MKTFGALNAKNAVALMIGAALTCCGVARADQVIPDDLIVQGAGCFGLDCVNNEAFGFDTLILKENNLRIFFNDTSVSAGFPANDWRITVNDSASGGANFFAIDDATANRTVFKLTAGARANSIFLGSNSKVGFGTATPVLDLHVLTSDTPAHRLEQSAAGGFTAQTWDIAGNEANFFVRDVTGGSRLPFRIRPGAPTSSIDIAATGFVGIGTASPQAKLHISSNADTTLELQTTGTSGGKWAISALGAFGILQIKDLVSGNAPFRVQAGAPTNSINVTPSGNIQLVQLANCSSGIKSSATGFLSCLPAPPGPNINVASDHRSGMTLASLGGSNASTASGQPSSAASSPTASAAPAGCSEGDMAGSWSMFGNNIEESGPNSVLWCDVQFTKAGTSPIKYSVAGNCRSHATNGATPQSYVVSGDRSITVTPACKLSGNFKIKDGKTTVTATIMEGRIEGAGNSKTRAVGVSRWPRGKTFALQTFVMQR